jgi:hypothetical protein
MDSAATALLSLETMGTATLPGTARPRSEPRPWLEHGEVSTWPMALEP